MGGDRARDKDWLTARGHHLCLTDTICYFFFFFFFWGGGGGGGGGAAGEHGHSLKGTLENNLLFLGHKTNVRGCLKIIVRNKADHKKLCLPYPCLPTYIPPTQHIFWHFLEIIILFWSCCYKKSRFFLSKYRVGVLQILNLKNDPLLENVVNYFQ